MDKVVSSAAQAVADVVSGSSLAVGGFGLCGIPSVLIAQLLAKGVSDLSVVSNNCPSTTGGSESCCGRNESGR